MRMHAVVRNAGRDGPANLVPFASRLAVGLVVIWLGLAGCGSREKSDRPTPPADKVGRVGMIFDVGGRGDKSFNDSAFRGLEMAKKELGLETELIEPAEASERESGLRLLAGKDLDLIVAVGFMFTDDINRVAREFPDRRFACVDYTVVAGQEEQIPYNVRALLFRDEEGTFLAGALAGLMTRSRRIGFIGGMDTPLIRRFERGFRGGVRYVNPHAEVSAKYAGVGPEAFKDPARGKELALGLYDAGADIIFHASGSTGLGVFEAARERQKYVIGVDSDQWDEAPGLVLTSVIKHVDWAVRETIRSVKEGTFRGGVTRMGLMSGGVELIFDERNADLVPAEVRARLDALRREIISKRIDLSGIIKEPPSAAHP